MCALRILFITNVPSPYRIKFFNALSKECNLVVVFEKKGALDRDIKWVENSLDTYKTYYLNGKSINNDSSLSFKIKKYLKKNEYDFVIFGNFSTLTGLIGINYCIKHKIDYCIEGDGAFYKKNLFKDIIKKRVIKHAIYCFSSCRNLDDYFYALGAKKGSVVRYRFTSVTKDELSNNSVTINKDDFKKEIGIKTNKIILYVGQFIKRKGVDILLRAFKKFDNNASLLLVGGNITQEYSNLIRNYQIQNVVAINFIKPSELSNFFKIADIFVLPTREDIWGLVVNEALSYGLPTITTTRCNAGLEIIKDGYNGYLVKPESDSLLSDRIEKLLNNKNDIRQNCLNSIKDYSIEQMVKDHMRIFENDK